MSDELVLRLLRPDDEAVVRQAHAEFAGEDFTFALFLDEESSFEAWLDRLGHQARGVVDRPRHVPAEFLLAEVDGQVVGRVSIRHELNDWLRHQGGHVGYGVRPAFRRRGYASAILRLSLERLAALGVTDALVTCADANEPSVAVIEAAGGTLEDVVTADDGVLMRRYWVPTR